MATNYTVSTTNAIWARALVSLNELVEASESGEFTTVFDADVIDAISYCLDIWLDGPINVTDQEFRKFASRLKGFANSIERRSHRDDADGAAIN